MPDCAKRVSAHRFGLVDVEGTLFFTTRAADPAGVRDLWMTDGTPDGARRVISSGTYGTAVLADPADLSRAPAFFETPAYPYFTAGGCGDGRELYGPTAPLAADLNARGGSDPDELVVIGRDAYFTADDGLHGREIWRYPPALLRVPVPEIPCRPGRRTGCTGRATALVGSADSH